MIHSTLLVGFGFLVGMTVHESGVPVMLAGQESGVPVALTS